MSIPGISNVMTLTDYDVTALIEQGHIRDDDESSSVLGTLPLEFKNDRKILMAYNVEGEGRCSLVEFTGKVVTLFHVEGRDNEVLMCTDDGKAFKIIIHPEGLSVVHVDHPTLV